MSSLRHFVTSISFPMPEQFGAFLRAELVKWGDIIKRSGTKLE